MPMHVGASASGSTRFARWGPSVAFPIARRHHRVGAQAPRPGDPSLRGIRKISNNRATKDFWVYILASKPGGTLYVGVTNDLIRRTFEHREGLAPGFTKKYGVKSLVFYEQHDTAIAAIQREKNIKHWPREWKIDLIVSMNPEWRDLYEEIVR
jgi:putative endonuclease